MNYPLLYDDTIIKYTVETACIYVPSDLVKYKIMPYITYQIPYNKLTDQYEKIHISYIKDEMQHMINEHNREIKKKIALNLMNYMLSNELKLFLYAHTDFMITTINKYYELLPDIPELEDYKDIINSLLYDLKDDSGWEEKLCLEAYTDKKI